MNQKAFFNMLGAPLVNSRWSWGAVRPADGVVFLRVWKDKMRSHDRSEFAQVTFYARFRGRATHGHRERIEQIARVRDGTPCYMILCEAVDSSARPRRIKRFDAAELFPGGRVVELDGEWWIEMLPGQPVVDVRLSPAGAPA